MVVAITTNACNDDGISKSVVPSIALQKIVQLKDVRGKDSLLILSISYADADGDIGLEQNDTFPPFNQGSAFQYNLFVDIKEIKNGNILPVYQVGTNTPENFNQRVPNLTPTGRNKNISGEISVQFEATKNYLYPDTIVCEIQLADRALRLSNKVNTGLISLKH